MRLAIAIVFAAVFAAPVDAAPIPRHLFPPETEPVVGWTWTLERYPYYLYKIDERGYWAYMGRRDNPYKFGGDGITILGPLYRWEVCQLRRGEHPDLSRLYR